MRRCCANNPRTYIKNQVFKMDTKRKYIVSITVAILTLTFGILILNAIKAPPPIKNNLAISTTTIPLQLVGKSRISITISDPQIAPNGTSAIIMNYSNIQVHLLGHPNATAWYPVTGSGIINLTALAGSSQIIGNTTVPYGSSIDMLKFHVSNAYAIINHVRYLIIVPSDNISTLTKDNNLGYTSSLNIQLSSLLTGLYTQNSTMMLLLASTSTAYVQTKIINLHTGFKQNLNGQASSNVANVNSGNLSVQNSQLLINPNGTTSFVLLLRNIGKTNITINALSLLGPYTVIINPYYSTQLNSVYNNRNIKSVIYVPLQSNMISNFQLQPQIQTNVQNPKNSSNISQQSIYAQISNTIKQTETNYLIDINGNFSNAYAAMNNTSVTNKIYPSFIVGNNLYTSKMLTFVVGSYGQLLPPFASVCTSLNKSITSSNSTYCLDGTYSLQSPQSGSVVPAESTATFIFNNQITGDAGLFTIIPKVNGSYNLIINANNNTYVNQQINASTI